MLEMAGKLWTEDPCGLVQPAWNKEENKAGVMPEDLPQLNLREQGVGMPVKLPQSNV